MITRVGLSRVLAGPELLIILGKGCITLTKGPMLLATNVKPYEGSGSGAKSLGAAATGSQTREGKVVVGYVKKTKPPDPPSDPVGSGSGAGGGSVGGMSGIGSGCCRWSI